MYSFLEQHLPRPFQHFKEQGLSGPTLSKPRSLPFCILERTEDRRFSAAKLPEDGPTGKFYQNRATGTKGGSFKNRSIVLSQSCSYVLISPIFTHLPVAKQPISQHVLDGWKRDPLPVRTGFSDMEVDNGVDRRTRSSSKMRPKPKKGLNMTQPALHHLITNSPR